MTKRKTSTSSEVKMRWMRENYKSYKVNLRFDTDQKVIDYIEERKKVAGTSEIIKEALEFKIKNS